MLHKFCVLLFILPAFSQLAWSQEDWVLKKNRDGIKVYSRREPGLKFDDLKVECTIDARLSQLVAVLVDYDHHPDWVFNTKQSYLVMPVSDSEHYFYTEVNAPWPIQNRDLAVHLKWWQQSMSKMLTVESNSVPDFMPDKEGIVRVPLSRVVWRLTPLEGKRVKVDYQIRINPGGSVPAWFVNFFSTKGPYESFSRLRTMVTLPRYRDASYRNIID